MSKPRRLRYYILRAAFYRQSLPRAATRLGGVQAIADEVRRLEDTGHILVVDSEPALTKRGEAELTKLAGGTPVLVDPLEGALRPRGVQSTYRVGTQDLREISRRVSAGSPSAKRFGAPGGTAGVVESTTK